MPELKEPKKKKGAGGRPTKYDPKNNRQVERLCRLGQTDKELADSLGVDEATINRWKKEHPEFCESIKKGKEISDARVANSLFKRAVGFRFDEVTYEDILDTRVEHGEIVHVPVTRVKTVKKLIIPDTTAQIFWLKNRKSKVWRDKQIIETTGNTPIIWNETKTYKK